MYKTLYEKIIEMQGELLYDTLSEECAEVIQACSKIKRNKFYNKNIDITNLIEEIGDLELNLDLIKMQLYKEFQIDNNQFNWVEKEISKSKATKIQRLEKIFLGGEANE